eukprot:PITA_13148
MAIADTIRLVVGIIGNIISVFMFLSPLPTFLKVWKWKSTRGFSGFPYPMTLLNCALWVLYGMPFVHPNSILVVTVNGAGVIFETVYTIVFLVFCKNKKEKMRVVGLLAIISIFFAAVAGLALTLEHTHKRRTLVIGTICIVFNVFMYAAPLSIMLPNGLGALLGASQLILYGVYYGSTRWDEDEEKESGGRTDKGGDGNSQPMQILYGGHDDNVDRSGIP